MTQRDLIKIFFDEIYSNPPRKKYPTIKINYNHIDEIWSIDLAWLITKIQIIKDFDIKLL